MSAAATSTRRQQPLEALQLPDALLRMGTLAAASGLSVSTLYRKAAAGELALVKMGARCTRVRSGDARAFIQALGAQS
ncbi:helix-turn-helix transcriptional regulator [Paucibacter sp. M5-1]|uniref:helix-turn-helix transcriptional regulator n=1 Tax=Paucibacter sp. M5-1 TaxID=3015998 RepID=UPI0022B861DD|nr:hypothetical protein [Paucibacter sp. M5-1]MCZ7883795.1 hypothetical protein [Paucibacter sp. M5-1]